MAPTGLFAWLSFILSAGAFLGVIVNAVTTALGWRRQRLLAEAQARRTEDTQHRIEELKTSLADAQAQRVRRAEYVRAQIENLYGPLAFLVESSARCIAVNSAILKTYDKVFARRSDSDVARKEAEDTIDRANEYMALVVDNNQEAIKILRSGWAYLDQDDIEEAGQYLADVHRHGIEYKTAGRMLPVEFYVEGHIQDAPGKVSFIRPSFIARVRAKHVQKQQELSGVVIGADAPFLVVAGGLQVGAPPSPVRAETIAAAEPATLPATNPRPEDRS
jgi:hypothetical protein